MAQLVEQSLLIPEIRGSTPVVGKILLNICLLSTVLKRRKINKKRLKMATLKKKIENTDELNYQNDRWQENVEEQLARKL